MDIQKNYLYQPAVDKFIPGALTVYTWVPTTWKSGFSLASHDIANTLYGQFRTLLKENLPSYNFLNELKQLNEVYESSLTKGSIPYSNFVHDLKKIICSKSY
ncbi:hypothetical protein RF11_12771 [Thelohanellus kitauei]|uniref:Uncharacterized protein n=1 Tax=Thelohanellus kitauei TaxID=669202 RepID=A0A0C2IWW1_THEKT|nr:hypothetical protein RF11_12771 [Thelohanellus kitauei]